MKSFPASSTSKSGRVRKPLTCGTASTTIYGDEAPIRWEKLRAKDVGRSSEWRDARGNLTVCEICSPSSSRSSNKHVVGKTSLFLAFSQSVMPWVFAALPFAEVIRLSRLKQRRRDSSYRPSIVYRRVRLKGEWRGGGDECNLQLSGDRQ